MGSGTVLNKGSLRLQLNTSRGFSLQGGHPETKGLGPQGQVIQVPLHGHEVSLDYLRLELELGYAFAENWGFLFRIPFDLKNQTAEIAFAEPVSPQEREAILKNQGIHHRTETYRSVSDLMLLATHNQQGIFHEDDFLKVSAGTTLPAGKTVENPYKLGEEGLKHLHIQFGTGTFDPLLEVDYRIPLARQLSLGAYAVGRLPLYENRETYQGPVEITSGLILSYRLSSRFLFHLTGTRYYQNFAHWDDKQDINSGLIATSGMCGVAVKTSEDTMLGLDVLYPFSQRTLSRGDAFEKGPTLLFRISWDLR